MIPLVTFIACMHANSHIPKLIPWLRIPYTQFNDLQLMLLRLSKSLSLTINTPWYWTVREDAFAHRLLEWNIPLLCSELRDLQFLEFFSHFQFRSIKISWYYIENDHKIERTEDRATRIITWTYFKIKMGFTELK